MIGAAKKKNLSLLSLAFVRVLLLLVVTLFLPQTRVWGFEAPPQHASGQIASASASAVVGNYDAWLYDASDCLVAAESGLSVQVSQKGLDLVANHLAQFDEFAPNTQMMQNLQDALAAGQKVTGANANFYLREASEAHECRLR